MQLLRFAFTESSHLCAWSQLRLNLTPKFKQYVSDKWTILSKNVIQNWMLNFKPGTHNFNNEIFYRQDLIFIVFIFLLPNQTHMEGAALNETLKLLFWQTSPISNLRPVLSSTGCFKAFWHTPFARAVPWSTQACFHFSSQHDQQPHSPTTMCSASCFPALPGAGSTATKKSKLSSSMYFLEQSLAVLLSKTCAPCSSWAFLPCLALCYSDWFYLAGKG